MVLGWKSLILATGARELFLPFPGWTLPGVVGAGGMQALVKQGYPVRGRKIVVAGSGPLLLAVAALMRSCGAIVPIILEQTTSARLNRFAFSLLGSPSKLLQGIAFRARLLGTRYATDSYPVAVQKTESGLRVQYLSKCAEASIECEHLACGFGLIPNNELAQLLGCELESGGFVRVDALQKTSLPDVYAIGELTGIGGVDKALTEGRRAAESIAHAHAQQPTSVSDLAFTRRLASAFALRPELFKLAQPNTLVCRCDDVPLSAVSKSLGARDAKLQTRCGMGPCQGRICGPILQRLINMEPPTVRPPLFAASLNTLCADGLSTD
jgi:pyruvate/2-oxoglutarate dehydrogenase complex dihydrolipoamide dehydrogenase (E3) component